MRISQHIYSVHIEEDPETFGAMHPGGTQIYFVGDPDREMALIDSGEPYRSWTRQILDFHSGLGGPEISAIFVTHGHGDHIGGLDRLQEAFDCEVRCHPLLERRLAHRLGSGIVKAVEDRESLAVGGATLQGWHTPGHEDDHIAYYLAQDDALFSGDTILGDSSTSVRDLGQYMGSLRIMARLGAGILCPGHGGIIADAPGRIAGYIRHREEREGQILGALGRGAATVDELVAAVYPRDLPEGLRGAAGRNVGAHLRKLVGEGRVSEIAAGYGLIGDGPRG